MSTIALRKVSRTQDLNIFHIILKWKGRIGYFEIVGDKFFCILQQLVITTKVQFSLSWIDWGNFGLPGNDSSNSNFRLIDFLGQKYSFDKFESEVKGFDCYTVATLTISFYWKAAEKCFCPMTST
ncbi:hypothetical protein LOAG_00161 [Loa loa]|uniref:Uncharacterized protein n=1 Tax=Loa loa TaxID=7209 RepID=A0A1S0UC22_LOALO|nr:hypothetical protein LOAG_00161 [Loa loa]EFO28304.1 hypothetical protein LOAG_00161 [Loa loa]